MPLLQGPFWNGEVVPVWISYEDQVEVSKWFVYNRAVRRKQRNQNNYKQKKLLRNYHAKNVIINV